MKTFQTIGFGLFLLVSTGLSTVPQVQAAPEQAKVQSSSQTTLEGTTWAGTDSDGDYYEFIFLKNGKIRYTTQASGGEAATYEEEDDDVWAQNGKIVIILLGNYATYLGTLDGDLLTGQSWNVVDKRWTWELKKK